MFRTISQWFSRSSDKADKLVFKNQREAAEFVRYVYDQHGAPNEELKKVYKRGRELRGFSALIK